MPQYFFKTFGCQMNENDSEKMEAALRLDGYSKATSMNEADVIVMNTCSIREKSYHKAISSIGQIKLHFALHQIFTNDLAVLYGAFFF